MRTRFNNHTKYDIYEIVNGSMPSIRILSHRCAVCTKSILTLGKEAIILGCDIIMGKSLIFMEASGNYVHFNT